MMKFYKSFLFLFILNSFFVWPVLLFLKTEILIPVFVFLFLFDLFLLFFVGIYLKRHFSYSAFTPDDPYGISLIFENLKKIHKLKNIYLFKTKELKSAFFCFSVGKKSFIVLSENLLENLSKQNRECLLHYPLQMIKSGDLFFLTLISGFLFFIDKFLYFLNYPVYLFKNKSVKKEYLSLIFILKIMSLITKKIFYNTDKRIFFNKAKKIQQGVFLWKLDSITTVCPPKTPFFMTPLFLTNPLADSGWRSYISLQPLMKNRLKALDIPYPPAE